MIMLLGARCQGGLTPQIPSTWEANVSYVVTLFGIKVDEVSRFSARARGRWCLLRKNSHCSTSTCWWHNAYLKILILRLDYGVKWMHCRICGHSVALHWPWKEQSNYYTTSNSTLSYSLTPKIASTTNDSQRSGWCDLHTPLAWVRGGICMA